MVCLWPGAVKSSPHPNGLAGVVGVNAGMCPAHHSRLQIPLAHQLSTPPAAHRCARPAEVVSDMSLPSVCWLFPCLPTPTLWQPVVVLCCGSLPGSFRSRARALRWRHERIAPVPEAAFAPQAGWSDRHAGAVQRPKPAPQII